VALASFFDDKINNIRNNAVRLRRYSITRIVVSTVIPLIKVVACHIGI